MNNYTLTQIASIVKAEYIGGQDLSVSVLLTDSRSLTYPQESLFFAIKGLHNNGHNYIPELYAKGVRAFVVEEITQQMRLLPEAQYLLVNNSVHALQQLAAAHRKKFNIPVIGITGSNGKTIIKEWLYQLLHDRYHIIRSPRSYNSQIGVPLSVWQLNSETQLGIFEAGISKTGEMENLASIIQPTIGILTNIGDAHQEGFKSQQEKCVEKLNLFKKVDLLIYNGDNTVINQMIETCCTGAQEIAWSFKDKDKPLYISKVKKEGDSTLIEYHYLRIKYSLTIPFIEDAFIENAIHALAVLLYFNVSEEEIREKMSQLTPVAMRLEVKQGRRNNIIINDSYNSDLNALEIALDFQQRRQVGSGQKKTVILSDIMQTGMLPSALYKQVAGLVMKREVDFFIGIGSEINRNKKLFQLPSEFYETTEEFLSSNKIKHLSNENILIKGARPFHFERISEELEMKQHETILEVDLNAIVHNLNYYRSYLHPQTKVVCMVKAFGYGAGSFELAKTLQESGCDYLAVAVADEGVELRQSGITMPILVMNPEMGTLRTLFAHNLEPEIYSFHLLKAFAAEAQQLGITQYPIHLKIDTGMHRLGFLPQEMPELMVELRRNSSISVRSVFSHLASADNPQLDDFTHQQINVFKQCAEQIASTQSHPVIRHILNTAGITRFPMAQFEMVRLGIGLYGISATGQDSGLEQCSRLVSNILQIKEVMPGECVGYNCNGKITRPTRIAMIPIGYADGLNRHLGNGNASLLVRGMEAPIIGNICMDLCMVDVTDIPCVEGDSAVVFGPERPVSYLSDLLQTIPYEVITSISGRVKRVYFKE